ncbi:hypothetical protein QAD02_000608 [Eretmocerus hayati]|uniref:Uncharacterized protein n=1 Tax=Eretmocerus hayati TaxID=131215 RepID=A0ACC2NG78_9HYME|nr:hypothetical protein QAD02_000608 [Eretmocerus hayati]
MDLPTKKVSLSQPLDDKQSNQSEEGIQANHAVLTYDVLRIIFQYLGARDLLTAAKTCRSWRIAARNEADTRRSPEFIFQKFAVDGEPPLPEEYKSERVGRDLRIKPSFGFAVTKVQEEGEWSPRGCYCSGLPSQCNTIILGGYEMVVNDSKISKDLGMATCLFFPEIAKLSHKLFTVDSHTFKGAADVDMREYSKKILKQLLPSKNEKSKCIIMLTNQDGYCFTRHLMDGLQKSYKPGTISLWGGVCVDLKVCKASPSSRTCSQNVRCCAITIASPTLQSWSVVLKRSCRTEAQIEEKLETFRNKIQLKKHSLGLMFACCERIDKKDLEIRIFKKLFPNVQLIGLHGDGEYGVNTLNEKREKDLQYGYSTIFLILTYQ